MQLPPGLAAQAVTFCSIQPCTRYAEGDLVIERGGQEEIIPVCPRHYEYIVDKLGEQIYDDPSLLSKEIVFVDDVGRDAMLDRIIASGTALDIIED